MAEEEPDWSPGLKCRTTLLSLTPHDYQSCLYFNTLNIKTGQNLIPPPWPPWRRCRFPLTAPSPRCNPPSMLYKFHTYCRAQEGTNCGSVAFDCHNTTLNWKPDWNQTTTLPMPKLNSMRFIPLTTDSQSHADICFIYGENTFPCVLLCSSGTR